MVKSNIAPIWTGSQIPKDIRAVLGVASGDRITFIVEGNTVRIVNSAVYAMKVLQKEMAGEAKTADLTSDDDVMALVKELSNEDENAWGFCIVKGRYFHICL